MSSAPRKDRSIRSASSSSNIEDRKALTVEEKPKSKLSTQNENEESTTPGWLSFDYYAGSSCDRETVFMQTGLLVGTCISYPAHNVSYMFSLPYGTNLIVFLLFPIVDSVALNK